MIFTENHHFVKGLDPIANAFAGTVRSDVVNMKNYHKATFVVFCGVGLVGTSVITVNACPDVTPSARSAVPFHYREITTGDTPGTLTAALAAGYTSTAGSSKIIVVEVDSQALAQDGNDYEYVELNMVESAVGAVLGGLLVILSDPRYAQNIHAPAIV